ncbi:MAG TPA: GEVED domain-containing protein [Bacteroidia bacterium]|nr:GEVED domain-containing protein [Bacteroidia bacterium]
MLLPKNRLLFIFFLLSCIEYSTAQVSTYTFQSDLGLYNELTSGTLLGDTSSEDQYFVDLSTPLGSNNPNGPGIPIGFSFLYNGFSYNVFGVNANGWIGLGNGSVDLTSVSVYFPLSSAIGSNFIAAFARNLQAQSGSSILCSTLGISPSRVLVVQWKNFRKHGNIGDQFNFQICLFEGSNRIEFSYGSMISNLNSSFVTVGMIGNDSSDFNLRATTTGGWASTTGGATNTATCSVNPNSLPDNGLRFRWEAPAPCTAPPIPGVTLSSLPSVCPNNPFIVSITGNSSGPGQTYQWQTSPDSLSWSDVTGATALSYASTQISPNWYRCAVTCSGQTAYSEPVYVDFSPPTLCYCTQNLGGDCMGYGSIDSVRISNTTLANLGSGCSNLTAPNYSDYPPVGFTTATLIRNASYQISVTTTFNASISAWIDYDQNGSFDATEWIEVSTATQPNVVASTLFIVPSTAGYGTTKMRIRTRAAGSPNGAIDACTQFFSGETEDYTITLDDGTGLNVADQTSGIVEIYPNPVRDKLILRVKQTIQSAVINLYNLHGKICFSKNMNELYSGDESEINLHSLSPGTYILEFQSLTGVQHDRVVVVH